MWLLIKKQLIDIKHKKILYLALFFIVMVGMIFYSGFTGAKNNILSSISDFYVKANLADYTIYSPSGFNQDELNSFTTNLDGTYDLVYSAYGNRSNDAFYYRNTFNTNRYELISGTASNKPNDIILDYDYAVGNNYKIGEYIILNNKAYYISGLAKFPNHIFKGNYFPDKTSTYIALKITDDIPNYNTIFIDSTMSISEINSLVSTYFTNDTIQITEMTNEYGYTRIEGDLGLVNSILFIFPLACFISIIIILFINYNRIIDEQKPYIGILKSNGFNLFKIYISLLIFPILLVIIAAALGSFIGVNTIPKYYEAIIGNYYAIPTITSSNLFLNVILPIIILIITTIITISIPILLIINKDPVLLLKNKPESKFGRSFLRKVKLPYHFKLIVRNIITSKRKNVCLIIASSLLLGIVLSVFYISDSLAYTDENLAKETYYGDAVLTINDDTLLIGEDKPIKNKYFYYSTSIKTSDVDTFESLIIYDNTNPCLKLKDANGHTLSMQEDGIFLPSAYRDFGYKVGDEITIYPSLIYSYSKGVNIKIANFIEEIGTIKFAISLQSLEKYSPDIYNSLKPLIASLPSLIELNDNYTLDDLATTIENSYDPHFSYSKLGTSSDALLQPLANTYNLNLGLLDNTSLIKENYGIINSYLETSQTIILMNDNLNIETLKICDQALRPNLSSNGIYLPLKYKDTIKDNITYYVDKKLFTLPIAGYIDSSTCYATIEYLNSVINYNRIDGADNLVLVDDSNNKLDQLMAELSAIKPYTDYTITSLNSFGERLGVINELLDFTKKLATVLATFIFILLVYNIGVIGLNNRLADIKVFKSAGLKNSKLKHMLSIENLVVILISDFLALPVGYLIAKSVINDIYNISSIKMIMKQDILSILTIVGISIILISVTSLFINRKINKMNLATLMKGDM